MARTQESLESEIAQLEATLASLQDRRKETEAKLKNSSDPAAAVKRHIKLLHDYNGIRDVALDFVGKIAEKEQCRAIDVLSEYDMDEKD